MVVAAGRRAAVPAGRDLFSDRTQLVQDYDGGHLGRFERHRIGFLMSMERPLGIGPMVFSTLFPEDEHNIWLKSLTTYGWLGFVCYVSADLLDRLYRLPLPVARPALAALPDDRLDRH